MPDAVNAPSTVAPATTRSRRRRTDTYLFAKGWGADYSTGLTAAGICRCDSSLTWPPRVSSAARRGPGAQARPRDQIRSTTSTLYLLRRASAGEHPLYRHHADSTRHEPRHHHAYRRRSVYAYYTPTPHHVHGRRQRQHHRLTVRRTVNGEAGELLQAYAGNDTLTAASHNPCTVARQ